MSLGAGLLLAGSAAVHAAGAAPPPGGDYFVTAGRMYSSTTQFVAYSARLGVERNGLEASMWVHGRGALFYPEAPYYVPPNIGGCLLWGKRWKGFRVGWGGCLWNHGDFVVGNYRQTYEHWDGAKGYIENDDPGASLTGAFAFRWNPGGRRFFVELAHASSAGATHFNRGRNLLGVGSNF